MEEKEEKGIVTKERLSRIWKGGKCPLRFDAFVEIITVSNI